jgi:hypothetical protein
VGLADIAPACVAFCAAFLTSVAELGIDSGFPFGYALHAYVIWVLANYFFEVLEHKATGAPEWPVLSIETIVGRRRQLGIVFAALLAIGAAVYTGIDRMSGRSLALAFAYVWLALLPASMAMLALTRNPARAANPALLFGAATRLRGSYVLILAAGAGVAAALSVAVARRGFLEVMLAAYLFLALAYFIGTSVYRHRLALGVHAPRSPEARAARDDDRLNRQRGAALDHAYGIASRGNVRGGLAYVEKYVESEPDPLAARAWMFDAMTRWEDPGPALTLGRDLLRRLGDTEPHQTSKLELRCALLDDALKQRAIDLQRGGDR